MRQHPRPFIYALLVHLVLLAVLMFSLDWTSTVKPSTSRKHAPIQAVAVDARQLDAELQRKQQLEEQKRRAEQEKLRHGNDIDRLGQCNDNEALMFLRGPLHRRPTSGPRPRLSCC